MRTLKKLISLTFFVCYSIVGFGQDCVFSAVVANPNNGVISCDNPTVQLVAEPSISSTGVDYQFQWVFDSISSDYIRYIAYSPPNDLAHHEMLVLNKN